MTPAYKRRRLLREREAFQAAVDARILRSRERRCVGFGVTGHVEIMGDVRQSVACQRRGLEAAFVSSSGDAQ